MIILNDSYEMAIIYYMWDDNINDDVKEEFLELSKLETENGQYKVDLVSSYILDIEEWIEQDVDNHSAEWTIRILG